MTHFFIAGGCGFIGSHVVRRLLQLPDTRVTVLDNFSSGSESHLADVLGERRLEVVPGDLKDLDVVTQASAGCDHAYHLAANPDIARAETEPSVDFWEGTYLTNNLLEACRINGVKRITYASGSGVYGDRGAVPVAESSGPMQPLSTYGASKLGCEAMLSAYSHMFEMHSVVFRFANVVGPRQTHGVTYDFVRRLMRNPEELTIYGDGRQSKSYIHVDDVIDAMFLLQRRRWEGFELYNVATEDSLTVKEIADLVVDRLGLQNVRYRFTGGPRGWKGDIPVVRFDSTKIRALGWSNRYSSKEAVVDSIVSNIREAGHTR